MRERTTATTKTTITTTTKTTTAQTAMAGFFALLLETVSSSSCQLEIKSPIPQAKTPKTAKPPPPRRFLLYSCSATAELLIVKLLRYRGDANGLICTPLPVTSYGSHETAPLPESLRECYVFRL